MRTDEAEWPIKFTFCTDKLEGELDNRRGVICNLAQASDSGNVVSDILNRAVQRNSSWNRLVRVVAWILRLGCPAGPLDYEEIMNAKLVILKDAQIEIAQELVKAVESGTGRFRKLAPLKDEKGVWRVGSRINGYVPFTLDSSMPAILPSGHRVTFLLMQMAHEFSHSGQDGTLARFRSKGFWCVKAGCLAKKVKSQCVLCRKISPVLLHQPMGGLPEELLRTAVAWGYCQLDLFGPYKCRGDVNPRTSKKTWGMIIVDCNTGAVHLDIVQDYSTNAVLLTLRRFGALRGWPRIICSDPGSQLESASGKLDNWFLTMSDSLRNLGSSKNFKWEISPADSPWRQGRAERRIAVVKKLITLSVGDTRLTPVELQTILTEVSNICNERPIGLSKPRADGTFSFITPNHLLLGRSRNVLSDDTELAQDLPMAARYRLVNHVTSNFWSRWASEVSPGLVHRQVWHKKGRNLQIGDVVLISEATNIKSKYRLGVVGAVKLSKDDNVRSATIRYVLVSDGNNVRVVRVQRSIQRLSLILPVEEQSGGVVVSGFVKLVLTET